MHRLLERAQNRRDFFRASARYGLLGLLSAAAVLAIRRGSLSGQTCGRSGICKGCGELAACGLPQALSIKQATGSPSAPTQTQ
jgi:hypothetical protein